MSQPDFLQQNKLSILLIVGGLVLISLGFLYPKLEANFQIQPTVKFEKAPLVVDIGGAVQSPGVYEIDTGEARVRVEDVISQAGGFHEEADLDWISKNINLATEVEDGMKIYIPKRGEAAAESLKNPSLENSSNKVLGVTNLININSATEAELDNLPAVGKVTAGKIVSGRPYTNINELKERKIVPNSTFEKIKNLVKIS